MTILFKIILFLAGMTISVQLLAAFYRILDLWYTINTAYPKMIKGILGWCGLVVVTAILLGTQWRWAFLGGVIFYVPFYVANFFFIQYMVKSQARPKEVE